MGGQTYLAFVLTICFSSLPEKNCMETQRVEDVFEPPLKFPHTNVDEVKVIQLCTTWQCMVCRSTRAKEHHAFPEKPRFWTCL